MKLLSINFRTLFLLEIPQLLEETSKPNETEKIQTEKVQTEKVQKKKYKQKKY